MKYTINSRKFKKKLIFCAKEKSGYVFVGSDTEFADKQLFDNHGNACIAKDEKQLKTIARKWIGRLTFPNSML
jgi:hypothetical protein